MAKTLTLVFLFLGLVAVGQADWVLSWFDEFEGPAGLPPNGTHWNFDYGGGGFGNNELEYYTTSTNNAALDGNGNLLITARTDDAAQYQCWYGTCEYTSARLLTKGRFDFTYGRFEARIKLPTGKGVWPAFWMMGDNSMAWPDCGEIDIVEIRGSDPTTIMGTIHGPGYSGGNGIGMSYQSPDGSSFSDDYHLYAIEWEPNTITWYVDDTAYQTHTPADLNGNTWVFDHSFFIIMNFAIGGNFDGDPAPDTVFPQSMTVDYVRAYTQA